MDVGLLAGIVWVLGQLGLVLLMLYVVVRVAVTHSLKAYRKGEMIRSESAIPPM